MPLLKIEGGHNLTGEVFISGSKNSALGILVASLLFDGRITINNVPNIMDIRMMLEIFDDLNINYEMEKNTVIVNSNELASTRVIHQNCQQFRASYYFMGALLGRYHEVDILYPGGCQIGKRPIDFHLMGFEALGGNISFLDESIRIRASKLKGTIIELPKKSLGATLNIIMAACYSLGKTTIINASIEPEVIDVISFLRCGGFTIDVIVDTIVIYGEKNIIKKSFSYDVMYDRIEAGTYLALGLIKGPLIIRNANYKNLKGVIYPLIKANARIEIMDDRIIVYPSILEPMDIKTDYYPGFPTDLEQIFAPVLVKYGGTIVETIFENRLSNCLMLEKMGANILVEDQKAVFEPSNLVGTYVKGTDLRGSASLLIAGLMAQGNTYLDGYLYIERGYENIYEKIRKIGGKLEFVDKIIE